MFCALGEEPVCFCNWPCHGLECPLQDPIPRALWDSPMCSFYIIIPHPSPLGSSGTRCLTQSPGHPVATPETLSPLHGICLLVSHRVLPHLAAHQAHPGSAEGHCQVLHPLPVHGEMSCQLPCHPQPAHVLVRVATHVQALNLVWAQFMLPSKAPPTCLHVVSAPSLSLPDPPPPSCSP